MAYRNLTLHPKREPWARQPDENAKMYGRFLAYRDMTPATRSYKKVAESYNLSESTVEHQAVAHLWQQRVAAWDAHEAAARRALMAERDRELCRVQLDMARAAAAIAMRALKSLADTEHILDPALLPKWVEMVVKLRAAAMDQPETLIGLVGADGGAIHVDARLEGLPDDERKERMNQVAEGWLRVVGAEKAS